MIKPIVFALSVLLSAQCSAQITFVDSAMTWEQLSKQAKKEKKLIFIHIEGQGCEHCNEVASQGFNAPVLKEKFEKHFVSTRVRIESENGARLATKFGLSQPLVSVFANADGNVLNKFYGSTSSGEIYLQQAETALERLNKKPLEVFDKEYLNGERSAGFMKAYIERALEMGQPVDKLLDAYAGKLSLDSLQNPHTIKFIYKSGPTLDSRIYKAINTVAPPGIIDSIYRSVAYSEATAMNNAIIGNSFRKAVQTKDVNLAYMAAGFSQNSHNPNFALGNIAQQRLMLNYYFAVKDTMSYMQSATQLLNFTHLFLSTDSLKRMDEDYFTKFAPTNDSPDKKAALKVMNIPPPSDYFSIELNEHAWHFYEITDKKVELEKALIWSKRSLEWFDELNKGKNNPMKLGNPAYLDTYAHILYKLGRKEEAIEWQTKAVEAGKAAKQLSSEVEAALSKMKAGTL